MRDVTRDIPTSRLTLVLQKKLYLTIGPLHSSCSCKGLHFWESWWSGKCCQQMPGWGLSFDLCCAIKSNFHSAHHQDYWELVFLLAAARIILTKPCITQPGTRSDFLTRAIYYLWRWFPVTLFQLNELNNNNFNERPRILASSALSHCVLPRQDSRTVWPHWIQCTDAIINNSPASDGDGMVGQYDSLLHK